MINNGLKKKHIFEEYVSSIVGIIFLLFALLYLGKLVWITPEKLTWTELGITVGIGAIGVVFLLSKFDIILRYLPKGDKPDVE